MSNNDDSSPSSSAPRARRGSFTTQTFNNIFGRSNSTAGSPTAPFAGPIATAAVQDQRRRMSVSTLGLSGSSPTQTSPFPFGGRRGSVSTAGSDSIDENAIDDDEGTGRSLPATPFIRRMSLGAHALRTARGSNTQGTSTRSPAYTTAALPTIPAGPRSSRSIAKDGVVSPSQSQASQASMQSKPRTSSDFSPSTRARDGGGFNWSEQLRSRPESAVSQSQRPSFSNVSPPPRARVPVMRERTRSVSELPPPPTQVPAPAPPPARPERRKPDAFQERILKGDFYMD